MTGWAGRVLGIAVAACALLLPASRAQAQHGHAGGHHGGYRDGSHFYAEHPSGGYGRSPRMHGSYAPSGHAGGYGYRRHRANYGRDGSHYAYSPYAHGRPPHTGYGIRWPGHSPSVRSHRYRGGHHQHH